MIVLRIVVAERDLFQKPGRLFGAGFRSERRVIAGE
jgi:hypothetical protein